MLPEDFFLAKNTPDRVFLGWDNILLGSVKKWLLSDAQRDHLAQTLVIVPTSNSGRRLRMSLSESGGVLSPRVMPPSSLFSIDHKDSEFASRQQSLWAWTHVIRSLSLKEFPVLFPNHDSHSLRNFSSALSLAKQMLTLRDMLADGDADFKKAQECSPEAERWHELEKLESRVLNVLSNWGLKDPVLAKREKARNPILPPDVKHVVVACVPDPTLLALLALKGFLSAGVAVTVLIHAPDSESASFDEWGIPLSDVWEKKMINIPNWEERLHVTDNNVEAAQKCVSVLAEEGTPSSEASVAPVSYTHLTLPTIYSV